MIQFPKYVPPQYLDYTICDDVFSNEEIERIQKYCAAMVLGDGLVGLNDGIKNDKIRNSKIHFIESSNSTNWIYSRFFQVAAKVNYENWNFNLTDSEFIQYSEYYENENHYSWHVDKGFNSDMPHLTRKLSIAFMLNDKREFEGGAFQVDTSEPVEIEPKLGRMVLFPSYVKHRVTPVTKGIRKSLVLWISGPMFQ